MTEVTLKVEGMSCNHCVQSVERSVGELAGVDDVKVNLADGKVAVKFDEAKVTRAQIEEVIDDQGYTVV
ncbi:copper chaperone CopZ [Paenibacillus camelliae]|uniref:copper chaperone CopZ n=1 Tax=Paenibacillus camelliae TaxID=512410 RepID=UPI00203E7245|nr:copper chaperone CopZ [Paenibacillus camelliae]MCM3634753.1 copper chaperone CopZ [Paenibacillus camelliae]